MRCLKSVIAAVIMVAGGQTAWCQELWQGARAGHTHEELRALFPKLHPLPAPVEYAEGTFAHQFLDQWEVAGEEFDVHFVMNGEGLDSVRLIMSEKDTGSAVYAPTFHKLETLLARRYGEPMFEMPAKIYDPQLLRMYENQFQDGDLTIKLLCFMCSTQKGSLDITYTFAVTEDASGL